MFYGFNTFSLFETVLHKSLVHPRLEYCVQAWSPFLRKDIELLENVKKRATIMIDGFADKDYNDRLK